MLLRQTKCQQPLWNLKRHVTRQLWNHKRQLSQRQSQLADLLLFLPEVKQQLKNIFLCSHISRMLPQLRHKRANKMWQVVITYLDYLKCLEKENWPLNYWGVWSKCSKILFIGGITVILRLRRYVTFRYLKLGTCNYRLAIIKGREYR